jgi:Flp pilus assembly protein TadD
MKEYALGIESAELSLVDVAAPSADTAGAVAGAASSAGIDPMRASTGTGSVDAARASAATGADRFLTKAIKEHAAGHIDRTLWVRAVAHAGGDDARAKSIYVQSRATALRVRKRENKAARYARVVDVLSSAPEPGFGLPAPGAGTAPSVSGSGNARRGIAKRNRRRAMVVAGVFGSLVVVAGLVVALSESDPVQQDIAANPAPRFNVFARSTPSTPAIPATAGTGSAEAGNASGEDLVGKVRALGKQGNWNLVVLYAVEWTRKQPGNADAWKELSRGYIKLRQSGEAQDAATKAVQLAPDDFLQWQNLGEINIALQLPAEALKAFHHAALLNDHDVVSLVQAGILNAQFGLLPEAGIAFAKALAVSPQHVQALCGAASVAQREGRVKDAQAMTRQVTSLGERCSDLGSASVRVAAGESPRDKTIP